MYGLFEDVQCHRHYRGSVYSVQRIRKDIKGGNCKLVFFTVPYYLCGRTEKAREDLSQGTEFPGRGLKREPPVYKLYVLGTHMPS